MTKEVALEIEGTVAELLRNSTLRVTLVNGHSGLATIAGKMRKFRIRVLAGDRVTLALSPYDLTRGRIVYRHKQDPSKPAPACCYTVTSVTGSRWFWYIPADHSGHAKTTVPGRSPRASSGPARIRSTPRGANSPRKQASPHHPVTSCR